MVRRHREAIISHVRRHGVRPRDVLSDMLSTQASVLAASHSEISASSSSSAPGLEAGLAEPLVLAPSMSASSSSAGPEGDWDVEELDFSLDEWLCEDEIADVLRGMEAELALEYAEREWLRAEAEQLQEYAEAAEQLADSTDLLCPLCARHWLRGTASGLECCCGLRFAPSLSVVALRDALAQAHDWHARVLGCRARPRFLRLHGLALSCDECCATARVVPHDELRVNM